MDPPCLPFPRGERQIRVWIDRATKRVGELVETNWQQIETLADILSR